MRDLPRRCWPARLGFLAATLALLALSACTVGPEWERFLAVIEHSSSAGQGLQVEVPEEVAVGEGFEVSVVSYYGGCDRGGGTETQEAGPLRRIVTPYDEKQIEFETVTGAPVNCPDVLRWHTHTATLEFSQPGTGTVVFRGFSEIVQDTIEVERSVEVR